MALESNGKTSLVPTEEEIWVTPYIIYMHTIYIVYLHCLPILVRDLKIDKFLKARVTMNRYPSKLNPPHNFSWRPSVPEFRNLHRRIETISYFYVLCAWDAYLLKMQSHFAINVSVCTCIPSYDNVNNTIMTQDRKTIIWLNLGFNHFNNLIYVILRTIVYFVFFYVCN